MEDDDMDELAREISIVLGIDAGMVSVVLVTPTEAQVTIVGETLTDAQTTATQLVQFIINNGGSGSEMQLLRKAIDARIRGDDKHSTTSSNGDDINAASRSVLMLFHHYNNSLAHMMGLLLLLVLAVGSGITVHF